MRILILGGSRFTGPHIVSRLTSWGHSVTLFNRGLTDHAHQIGVDRIIGNRDSLIDSRADLVSVEAAVVIDMIAFSHDHAKQFLDVFRHSNSRIVLISSIDVYRAYGRYRMTEPGEPDLIPLIEDDPLRTTLLPESTVYDKPEVERLLRETKPDSTTILRLPMIYGPNDGQHRFREYLSQMDSGISEIVLSPKIAEWRCASGYVEDIALAIALAAKNSRAAGKTYNVADSFAFTQLDYVRAIGRAANWDGVVKVGVAVDPTEDKCDYAQHLIVDSSAIRRDLGYKEEIPINEAFKRTVEWDRNN